MSPGSNLDSRGIQDRDDQGKEPADQGDDPDASAILDALGDETCRTILRATIDESATVEELADECDVSETTVYRRISRLGELGLVESSKWTGAVNSSEYESAFETVSISLQDGDGLDVGFDRQDEPTDAIHTLKSLVEIERAEFDRESNAVELRLTADDELFEALFEDFGR